MKLNSSTVSVDQTNLRSVCGLFCSGVTVVTARHRGRPVGLTCQSFSSLSLDPPYIALCIGRDSLTWPLIRQESRFCVNILADHQEGVCQQFARSGGDKFSGVNWTESPNGSPLLDGVLGWIDCSLVREFDGGDHVIAIGQVTHLGQAEADSPLLYYRSSFQRLP
ncbi:flavin reductase family protein [Streptomyces caniferus]|uniref:flavin reductase family protein n=1 Tax=Streptomyces caniferus TaxID=285557 RepID=UPI0034566E53